MTSIGRAPESPYSSYESINVATDEGLARLKALLLPATATSMASESILDHILGPGGPTAPLTKTVVAEHDYVDLDHSRAHAAFFSRAFGDIARKTTRLHLFATPFSEFSLEDLAKHASDYLGFSVCRPLRVRRAGRTVVPLASDVGDVEFITVPTQTAVNLAGVELNALGPPFIEQDERVSRCATAAIWISTTSIADQVRLPRYSTAEITQMATRFFIQDRPMPSSGLYPQQMAEALRAMGYEVLTVGAESEEYAAATTYAYVESGIPVILWIRLPTSAHVVSAVGHGWSPNNAPTTRTIDWIKQPALAFHHSAAWVPYFLAHDDETGPYIRFRFLQDYAEHETAYGLSTATALRSLGGVPVVLEKSIRHKSTSVTHPAVLMQMIVPNPPGVTLTASESERKSARLVAAWHEISGVKPPTNLVLRTYLARSNDFKRWVTNSSMHPTARHLYQGKQMPRWLWVTEISEVPWMNASSDTERLIRGEVVIDATSSPWTADFLAFHFVGESDGVLATMLPTDEDAEVAMLAPWRLPGERPYRHLGRHLGGD